MMTEPDDRHRTILGVRRGVWLVLAAALLLALAVPTATLWHASTSALHVQTCVFPAAPRVGQRAWLVVAPADAADRTALEGPWATVVTRWDMVSMSMGTLQRTIAGSTDAHGAFAVPLELTMPGVWWAQVALSTPGRPQWQQSVHFAVSFTASQAARDAQHTASSAASVPWRDPSPCAKSVT
jgi:hypothetical protein